MTSNPTNPTSTLVENHRDKKGHVVENDASAKSRLVPKSFAIVKCVLFNINEAAGVHSKNSVFETCAIDDAAVGVLVTDDRGHPVHLSRADSGKLPRYVFAVLKHDIVKDPPITPTPRDWRLIGFANSFEKAVRDAYIRGAFIDPVSVVRHTDSRIWKNLKPFVQPGFGFLKLIPGAAPIWVSRPAPESVLVHLVTHVDDIVPKVFEIDFLDMLAKRQRILVIEWGL